MKENSKNLLHLMKQDWVHSASGTSYCLGDDVPLRAFLFSGLTVELQVVLSYRIYAAIYNSGFRVVAMLLYLVAKFVYKCDIHPKCKIGGGLLLVHGFNVVIGPDAILGEDVVVFNGVNIGKKYVGEMHAPMPLIGDRCVIGTGAKVLGGITLGDEVKVGANSVVLHDIPPGTTCVGAPAKSIKKGRAW